MDWWRTLKRWQKVLLVVVVLIVLVAVIPGSGDDNPQAGTATTSPPTSPDTTGVLSTGPTVTTTLQTTTTVPATTTTSQPVTFEPFTLSGSGDDIVDLQVPNDLPAILNISSSGTSNIAVLSYDQAGGRLDLLVNEIGVYQGARPVNLYTDELVAELEITASGAWEILVNPILAAPVYNGDLSGTGDAVILVGAVSGRLHATHNGSSNFAVLSHGTDRDLLINEIGVYEGTVRLDDGALLIEIEADGAWTLTEG
ncbi:MAG: hypothetical protein P1T08_12715 [Acidimicrobiia bacterium]|nr:hypothetical protein [Acidimicrobiia bacterium]